MNYNVNMSEDLAVLATIPPQSATGTYTSGPFNLEQCRRALALVHVGTPGGSATVNAQFLASTTSGGSYTAIAGAQIAAISSGTDTVAELEIKAESLSNLGVGPWLKLQVVVATAATPFSAEVLGGVSRYSPTSDNNIAAVAAAIVV